MFAAAVLGTVSLWAAPPTMARAALDLPGCRDTTLHRNDDESSGLVGLPFEVDFYGNSYDSLYVNNNGNVTFDSPLGEYVPFDLTQTDRVIIAPYFADVDTRPTDGGTVTYGETTYGGRAAFCVLWDEVGYYPFETDLRNTFQLLLVRTTPGSGDFDIVFRYETVQWELGSASGGVSARVGFSNGDPTNSVELAGSAQNGAFLDWGPQALTQGSIGSVTPGTWIFHVRSGIVGNDPRNVPPGLDRSTTWWTWPDGDGDGLPNDWERNGVWVGDQFVDLAALGADSGQKDAFIYVDVVEGERWNSTIESMLRSSFAKSPLGVRLHIIRGKRTLRRNEVPAAVTNDDSFFSQMVRLGFADSGLSGSPGSVPALAKYVCVCPDHARGDTVGGEANGIKADHLVVTVYEARWLGAIYRETGIWFPNDDLVGDRLNAITTMHELGHLYGLRHRGTVHWPNNDPSYRSIMSYAYNAFGVPRPADEAIATGDLLPRIDYSRENSVNYDWRMGGAFGALSFVYGQHGERGNFYTTVDDIPDSGEEAPIEAGIDELLADPVTRGLIAQGAREVQAALGGGGAGPSSTGPLSVKAGRPKLGKITVKRGRVLVPMQCRGEGPCSGKLTLTVAAKGQRHGRAHRRGTHPLTIGKAPFAIQAGSSKTIRIELSSAGSRALADAGKRGLEVKLVVTGLRPRLFKLTLG